MWSKGVYVFLTDVVVFPQVAEGYVASQQHSYATEASLLHIDVLVVVSVMAWREAKQKTKWHKPQVNCNMVNMWVNMVKGEIHVRNTACD